MYGHLGLDVIITQSLIVLELLTRETPSLVDSSHPFLSLDLRFELFDRVGRLDPVHCNRLAGELLQEELHVSWLSAVTGSS